MTDTIKKQQAQALVLAKRETKELAYYAPSQLAVIKSTTFNDLTEPQFKFTMELCRRCELDPMNDVYAFQGQGGRLNIELKASGWVAWLKKFPEAVKHITVNVVYQGDDIEMDRLDGKVVKHTSGKGLFTDKGDPIGAYAQIELADGRTVMQPVRFSEYVRDTGPWKKYPTDMIQAKAIKRAARIAAPLSMFLRALYAERDAIRDEAEHGTIIDVDARVAESVEIESDVVPLPPGEQSAIFAIAKERGFDKDKLHRHIYSTYGVQSTMDISKEQAQDLIAFLKSKQACVLKSDSAIKEAERQAEAVLDQNGKATAETMKEELPPAPKAKVLTPEEKAEEQVRLDSGNKKIAEQIAIAREAFVAFCKERGLDAEAEIASAYNRTDLNVWDYGKLTEALAKKNQAAATEPTPKKKPGRPPKPRPTEEPSGQTLRESTRISETPPPTTDDDLPIPSESLSDEQLSPSEAELEAAILHDLTNDEDTPAEAPIPGQGGLFDEPEAEPEPEVGKPVVLAPPCEWSDIVTYAKARGIGKDTLDRFWKHATGKDDVLEVTPQDRGIVRRELKAAFP